jgi:hypothetical protein
LTEYHTGDFFDASIPINRNLIKRIKQTATSVKAETTLAGLPPGIWQPFARQGKKAGGSPIRPSFLKFATGHG